MKINAGTKIKLYQQIVIFAKQYIQCMRKLFIEQMNKRLGVKLLKSSIYWVMMGRILFMEGLKAEIWLV